MKKSRLKKFIYSITIALGLFALNFFPEMIGENVRNLLKDKLGIETGYLLAAFVVLCAVSLVILTRDFWKEAQRSSEKEDDERYIKRFCYELNKSYLKRYNSKLGKHFEIPLYVNENSDNLSLKGFKGQSENDRQIKGVFDYGYNIFKKKGYLLILGDSGGGKTVLLLKLALKLFKETNIKKKEPFPVIFNLESWSKEYQTFDKWLLSVLISGEGLSKDLAEKLLKEERIIFLLDGLDELARNKDKDDVSLPQEENKVTKDETLPAQNKDDKSSIETREDCLKSLFDYLDGGKKFVICCRNEQFFQLSASIRQEIFDEAKVEIPNLTRLEILWALEQARTDKDTRHHASAKNLIDIILELNPRPLLNVLSNPFFFTIALEVFDDRRSLKIENLPQDEEKEAEGDPEKAEKDLEKAEKDLKNYLIESFIEKKLDRKPPESEKFKNTFKTRLWLKWLAKYLNGKSKVTFELSDLQPYDLKWITIFELLYGLIVYFWTGFPITLLAFVILMENNPPDWKHFAEWVSINPFFAILLYGAFFAFMFLFLAFCLGLPASLIFGLRTREIKTEDSTRFSLKNFELWETWKDIILACVLYPLITIPFFIIAYFEPKTPFEKELNIFSYLALIIFLFVLFERILAHSREVKKFAGLNTSYQRLRMGIITNIIKWNLVAVFLVFIINLIDEGINILNYNFRIIILFLPFTIIISLINTPIFKHFVLRFCLILTNKIPIRYAAFLDFVAEAEILEKDGGHWRFRHKELQDYFVNLKIRQFQLWK